MKLLFLGGDRRQIYAARCAAQAGFDVDTYGLDPVADEAADPTRLVAGADVLVLPMPVSRRAGLLNAPLAERELPLAALLEAARPGARVLAGMPDEFVRLVCDSCGMSLVDYASREEIAAAGAVSTAEAALALMVQNMPGTIAGSRVLVVGAGRIGTRLAQLLQCMGADVSVSARKKGDLARIEACGLQAVETSAAAKDISGFDAVVNTVPVPLLDAAALKTMDEDCFLLDLASAPGGVADAAAVKKYNYMWALGLPGKTAPVSAGQAVGRTVINILKELEEGLL